MSLDNWNSTSAISTLGRQRRLECHPALTRSRAYDAWLQMVDATIIRAHRCAVRKGGAECTVRRRRTRKPSSIKVAGVAERRLWAARAEGQCRTSLKLQ